MGKEVIYYIDNRDYELIKNNISNAITTILHKEKDVVNCKKIKILLK